MIRKLTLDSLFLILLLAAYSKGGGAATVVCPGIRRGDGTCCYPTICPRDQQYRLCKDRTAVSRDTCEKCSEGMINPKSVDTRNSTYSDYEYDMCFTPQCDCALGAILTNEYDCLKNGKKRKCICDLQNGYWGDPNICQSVNESMLKRIQKPGVELTQSGQIMPCKNGTFKENGDNSVCRPHTKCKNGEELKTLGTTTSDSVCYQSPVNDITLPVPESTAESSVPVYPPTNETEGYPGEADPSKATVVSVLIYLIVTILVVITTIVVCRLSKKGKLHITCICRILGIHQNLNFPPPDHRDFSTSQQNTGLSSDTEYYTDRSEFSFQADTQEHPPNGRDQENSPLLINVSVDEHGATGETSAKTGSENVRIEIENITDPKYLTPQVPVSHPDLVWRQASSSSATKLTPSGDEISKHNLMEDTHLIPLRKSFYDIIILCADNDRMEAEKYKDHLENDIISENGLRIKVALCKRAITKCLPAGHKIKSYREVFERCNFVFVYLTKSFCESELCSVLTEACLMQDAERKKWQVVLIHTVQKSKADFQIPMALNAERGINYYDNDLYYRREVEKLICSRLHICLQHEEREFSEQYKLKCEHHDKDLKEPLLIQENGKVVEEEESYKCEQVKDRGGSAGVSSHCHLSNVSEDQARQSTSILQSNSSLELRIDSLLQSSGSLDDSNYRVDHSIGSLDHESGSLKHCRDSNVHTQDMASQTADTNQPYRERETQQGNITIHVNNHIYNQTIMPNKANIIIGDNNMIFQSVDGCSNGGDDDASNKSDDENEENNYNEEDNQSNSTARSQVHSDDKSVWCESLSSDSTGDQRVDGSNVATATTAWADCVREESLMTLETSNRTEEQEESEIGHTTSVKKVDSSRSIS